MKAILQFGLFALIGLVTLSLPGQDTVYFYNTAGIASNSYYSSGVYPQQMARLDLNEPMEIEKIRLLFTQGTGNVRVRVYGNEGRADFPEFFDELAPEQTLTKTQSGVQVLEFVFPSPVTLRDNQFFIHVDQYAGSLQWLTDNTPRFGFCESNAPGGSPDLFFNQYVRPGSGWIPQNQYYAVELVGDVLTDPDAPLFRTVTGPAGLDTTRSNKTMAWGDYNGDGRLDFLVAGRLYRKFNTLFFNVTNSTGANPGFVTPDINAFLDMDNDGDVDILHIGGANRVMLNNGSGSFSAQPLSLPAIVAPSCYSIADVNNDNYPDLFIGQSWDTDESIPLPNYLFINNEQNGFTDGTTRLYPNYNGTDNFPGNPSGMENTRSKASGFSDFDGDGDQDLFIANTSAEEDELFLNDGQGNFSNVTVARGVDQPSSGHNSSTGADWGDYDNDGHMDLLVAHASSIQSVMQDNHTRTALYQSSGAPNYNFTDQAVGSGIEYDFAQSGGAWGDLNNDGLLDFITTANRDCHYAEVYIQQPNHSFVLSSADYGLQWYNTDGDAAIADYNDDGKLDVAIGKRIFAGSYDMRLFRNEDPTVGDWVQLDLESTTANTMAIGARVQVYADGDVYMQEVTAGRGQRIQRPARLHFGLGSAATLDSIIVRWPAGNYETFYDKDKNMVHDIVEGEGGHVGISPTEGMALKVWPNPVVESRLVVASEILGRVEILDVQGRLVRSTEKDQVTQTLMVSDLSPGMYYIRLTGQDGRVGVNPFVKQ